MPKTIESRLYVWGWIFFIFVAALTAVKRIFFPEYVIQVAPCVVYSVLGVFCPGCGGTRAVAALFQGRLFAALVDFPMLVYCVAVYLWFMASHTVERASRGRIAIGMKYRHGWIYASLVILIVHWVVKNIYYLRTGLPPFL